MSTTPTPAPTPAGGARADDHTRNARLLNEALGRLKTLEDAAIVDPPAAPAEATDEASAVALVNAIRARLIAVGIWA